LTLRESEHIEPEIDLQHVPKAGFAQPRLTSSVKRQPFAKSPDRFTEEDKVQWTTYV
jgi:hypothetical protein